MTAGKQVVVTGGLGFIGSCFVRNWMARHPEDHVTNVDSVTYAADPARIPPVDDDRYMHLAADITDREVVAPVVEGADYVVHFAAESHVDRSISASGAFVQANIVGTHVLLEAARDSGLKRFHHVSTDEVFGSLDLEGDGRFHEATPYAPRSPYSASKAAADHLVRAYHETYGLDITITNGSNNYGPYQHPEKFIPRLVTLGLSGQPLPVYGTGENVRDWLQVEDYCDAIERVLRGGRSGRTYCVGGDAERSNLEIAREICGTLGLADTRIEFVADRLGHDLRYAVDSTRIRNELEWRPRHDFQAGLAATIEWYKQNASWWRAHATASEAMYATKASGRAARPT